MPINYITGEQTKLKIYEVSKQLFYKQGYDETTYDQISRLADANRALIPYYYKNKKNLAYLVHKELLEDYFSICDQALLGSSISEEGRTAYYMFGFYRLMKNRNFSKFLVQFHSAIDYNDRMIISKKRLFDILGIMNHSISRYDYEVLAQMDYGIEKEVIRHLYYNYDYSVKDIDHLSSVEFHLILGFLGYPKEKIDAIISEALTHLSQSKILLKGSFDFALA